MRPKRIILVRHGESEANQDKSIHDIKPDYAINLTEQGKHQIEETSGKIRDLVKDESVFFYRSPFYRTRQTHDIFKVRFPLAGYYEDPRLREQERHTTIKGTPIDIEEERDAYGHFYYRFENGESCADVFDRVSDFMNTMFRDFEKSYFPDNCILVAHGMTNRVFLMRFFHMSIEEFELLRNPKNGDFYVLEKQESGKYKITKSPALYEEARRKY